LYTGKHPPGSITNRPFQKPFISCAFAPKADNKHRYKITKRYIKMKIKEKLEAGVKITETARKIRSRSYEIL
jgi:hypothetical protein